MKLNRNRNQRQALIRTQLNALVNFGHLTTTQAKARLIKPLFDRLVTRAKVGTVASRRLLAKELARVDSANRLVDVIAPLFADKNSGYTTSSKVKIRRGDATTMVMLKLTKDLPASSPSTPEAARTRDSSPASTPEAARTRDSSPAPTPEAARTRDSSGVSSTNKTKK